MDVDELFGIVGEFGKFQKFVLWVFLLPGVFPCGFHAYNQLFMAASPLHWCAVPELKEFDESLVKNLSIPKENNEFSKCLMYDLDYINWKNGSNFKETTNNRMIPCKNGWNFEQNEVESIVMEWQLVCEKDFLPTIGLVILGIGGFIGNFIFGYIQDGLGRKPAFFIYLAIQTIFGIATAFANNFVVWALFRFGVGFTVPAILGTPYVLAIELVGPKNRTLVTILINIAYSLALILLAIIVYWIRNWRILALSTTIPFIFLFIQWWFLPESPRWLLAKEKYEEAEVLLRKMASANGKKVPANFSEIIREKSLTCTKPAKSYGVLDLFKAPQLRYKTIIITFIWFTNTSVYVGLSYYAPALGGDEYLNFFLAGAVELPTYLFLWSAMENLGRRWTLCLSMIVGGSACLATFLVQNENFTLGLFCIGKMGISSSFVVLPLVASEIYPTVIRGLGMSISSVVGMIGPILIPLINYLGSDMLTLPLIIMGVLLLLGGAISLLLPETLHKKLPQNLVDAETSTNCFCPQKNNTLPMQTL